MEDVIREGDRTSFKRCRRQWDLGSRSRQNLEPLRPRQVYDLERAVHDALALWYFPGMWEWERGLVLRFAMEGFEKSMRKQLEAYATRAEVSPEQEMAWESDRERGRRLLEHYFAWAPGADAFTPVRVDTDFDANIPEPGTPGFDLVGPRGPIHYKGRVELLVVDAYDAYWIVDHRLVEGGWEELDQLLLDERGVGACWAWEIFYYGMQIAGTIYNELRLDAGTSAPPPDPGAGSAAEGLSGRRRLYMQAAQLPGERVTVSGSDAFRRTRITRSRAELAACGVQVAAEARDMTSLTLPVYPHPSPAHCPACAYQEPCRAMNQGQDPAPILARDYADRGAEEIEEGRLGAVTWSMNRGARPPGNFGGGTSARVSRPGQEG